MVLVFLSHPPLVRAEKMTFQRQKKCQNARNQNKDRQGWLWKLLLSLLLSPMGEIN